MSASQTTRRIRVTAGAGVFIAAGFAYAFSTADEAPDNTMNGVVYAQNPEADTMLDTGDMVEPTAYSDYVAPQATGCDELELVGTEAGVASQLPATTTVLWTKGDPTQEAVAWDGIDPANYEQGGTFYVNGTVGDTGLTATIEVNAAEKPAPTIESLEEVNVTTPSGTAPELPATVSATMFDGSTSEVDVAWNAADPSQYGSREAGVFDVTGTVEGAADAAVAYVTVEPASIASLENPAPISRFVGHEPELPATVKATWSNGDVTDETVS